LKVASQLAVWVSYNSPVTGDLFMPFKLVVFDFDGTLVDSLLMALDIFNRFAAKYRYKPIENPEAARSMTTRQFMKHHGISLWRLPRLVRKFHAAAAGEAEKLKLYPGLAEVLAGLQENGTRLGILSSNKEDNIRRCLRVNGAEEFFAFVVGYPKLFGKGRALRRIIRAERIARGDVLYVGDELRDMEAARKAGVASAAVTWGFHAELILREFGPDHVVTDPAKLLEVARMGNAIPGSAA
jgi:phosphoglycolate phosphatase